MQIGGAASVRQRHALPLSDGQGEPSDVPVHIEIFTKLGPLGFEPRTKGL